MVSWRFKKHARHGGPCRKFGGVDACGVRRITGSEQVAGGGRFSGVLVVMSVRKPHEHGGLLAPRRTGQNQLKCAVEPGPGVALIVNQAGGQAAGGLHVRRIVQEHKGLERRVRPRPLHHAFLASRGVEGKQARVQKRALPVGVQGAAVLVVSLVRYILTRGKVEEDPVARRLVRFDARTADLVGEQAATGECAIANQLGIEPVSVLMRIATGWRGRAGVSSRARSTIGGRFLS